MEIGNVTADFSVNQGSFNKTITDNRVNNSVNNSVKNSTSNVYHGDVHNNNNNFIAAQSLTEIDLKWLDAKSYESQLEFLSSQRTSPESGLWFVNHPHFEKWRDGKAEDAEKVLYCPGIPGAGKSVLASLAIQELQRTFRNEKDVAVAYIICNYNEQEQQKTVLLVKSLLRQLSVAWVEGSGQAQCPVISAMNQKHQSKGGTTPSFAEYFDAVKNLAANFTQLFIVVDAIDEISEDERNPFIAVVKELVTSHGTKMLVTTRPIQRIGERFKETFATLQIDIEASDDDVGAYVRAKIAERQELKDLIRQGELADPDLDEKIVRGIQDKAKGMFLLAKFHVGAIAEQFTVDGVYAALESLPSNAIEVYAAVLARITAKGDGPHAPLRLAKRALLWATYCQRPLRMVELQHAVAISDRESVSPQLFSEAALPLPGPILAACDGLLVLDLQEGVVRLVHYTAQEYL
ncbi:hypothetical protein DFH27DRAFT_488133, partial [Peziza echinospora]